MCRRPILTYVLFRIQTLLGNIKISIEVTLTEKLFVFQLVVIWFYAFTSQCLMDLLIVYNLYYV